MSENDLNSEDARRLACANLIACQTIVYDSADTDAGYSLNGVLVHIRPPSGTGFPFVAARQCLFAQLHGTPGDYIVRVRQVRVALVDDEEQVIEITEFGPWEIEVPGENYVECFGFILTGVQYPEAGVYEFQFWADGFDDLLGRERLDARE